MVPAGLSKRVSSAYGIHDFGRIDRTPVVGVVYTGGSQCRFEGSSDWTRVAEDVEVRKTCFNGSLVVALGQEHVPKTESPRLLLELIDDGWVVIPSLVT